MKAAPSIVYSTPLQLGMSADLGMSNTLTSPALRSKNSIGVVLRTVDARPTVAAYRSAAELLKNTHESLRAARVAVLSTFTADTLTPYLEVEAARLGFLPAIYHGPFNAIQQELLSPQSGCVAFQPDVVFLAQLIEDVCPTIVQDFLTLSPDQVQQLIANTIENIVSSIKTFRQNSAATVVVYNFVLPPFPLLGIYEAIDRSAQTQAIHALNQQLAQSLQVISGVHVLDFDRACAGIGYGAWRHDEMWYTGRAPLSPQILPSLGRLHATFMNAIIGTPRKCLVVDLDNTLWGGVIGEDGLPGIHIGHTYPGNIYRDIQQAILQLYRRGVLLAICSKNNEADVDEVFNKHPDMILRREHFAATRVNWRAKSENLREIAAELSIGMDSFVFLDDSPAECEMMRQQLPEVFTWDGFNSDGQPDPLKMLKTLLDSQVFDKLSLTDDDRKRNEMYQQQSARKNLSSNAASLDEFLTSLEMTVDIQPVDDFSLPRVIDLIHKTNQFNLTSRRHSATKIKDLLVDQNTGMFTIRVADRFGDNGIVGVAIMVQHDELVQLDTLLLSCRVIGRTVETAFIHHLASWAKARGAMYLQGEFFPTAKNQPAANFFAQHGFSQIDSSVSGSRWLLELDAIPFEWPTWLRRAGSEDLKSSAKSQEDRVLHTIADVFGLDWRSLNDDSSPETITNWDSLNHLNLVMAIESEFEISLSAKDIFAMQSIASIRRVLDQSDASDDDSSLVFCDCQKEDIPNLKTFIAKSYGSGYVLGTNDAYFEWQYASPTDHESYRLRLAKVDGQIAGCLGYIPVDVNVGGKKYQGSWLANWMVDPDYRHLGIGPLLAREVAREFEVTLALGANEEARSVLAGLGWTDFNMLRRYVRVLDTIGARVLTESEDFQWPITLVKDLVPPSSISIVTVERFEKDAEQLWDQLRGVDHDFAGTRRTVEYLNWRYADHSQFTYSLFEARESGELVGFAVYRIEKARDVELRVGRIVEMVAIAEAEDSLMSAMLSDASDQMVVALDFFCAGRQFDELLERHGFLTGEDSRAQQIPMLYQPIDRRRAGIRFLADLSKAPESARVKHWYVTKSDGDQDRPN